MTITTPNTKICLQKGTIMTITTPTTKNKYVTVSYEKYDPSDMKVETTIIDNDSFIIKTDDQTISIDNETAFALLKTMIAYLRLDDITDKIETLPDNDKITAILKEYVTIKYPTEQDLPEIVKKYTS